MGERAGVAIRVVEFGQGFVFFRLGQIEFCVRQPCRLTMGVVVGVGRRGIVGKGGRGKHRRGMWSRERGLWWDGIHIKLLSRTVLARGVCYRGEDEWGVHRQRGSGIGDAVRSID